MAPFYKMLNRTIFGNRCFKKSMFNAAMFETLTRSSQWKFDETAGLVAVDSSGSLNATAGDTVTWSGRVASMPGVLEGFALNDDQAANFFNSLDQYTLHFYGAQLDFSDNEIHPMISRGGPSGWQLSFDNPNDKIVWAQSGIGNLESTTLQDDMKSLMHLITIRQNGSSLDMFVDGVFDTSSGTSSGLADSANVHGLFFGIDNSKITSDDKVWEGFFDEITFHNYAQTNAEILNYSRGLITTHPVAITDNMTTGSALWSTGLTIDYPEANSGELYIAAISAREVSIVSPMDNLDAPVGWTQMYDGGVGEYKGHGIFYKLTDGTDNGGNVTWDLGDTANGLGAILRVKNVEPTVVTDPFLETSNNYANAVTHQIDQAVGAPDTLQLNIDMVHKDAGTSFGNPPITGTDDQILHITLEATGASDPTINLVIYRDLRDGLTAPQDQFNSSLARAATSISFAINPIDGSLYASLTGAHGLSNSILGV